MKAIAVFCGSSRGINPLHTQQARELGQLLAQRDIELIYGGSSIGLMTTVADAALANGGKVTGVMPDFLRAKEIAHRGLTRQITVGDMHERKSTMYELCDGVIALPGGFGTLDELFECLTWAQLGLHTKPIAILNTDGFYTSLFQLLDQMVSNGLLRDINRKMLLEGSSANEVLELMTNYTAPDVEKWILPNHI